MATARVHHASSRSRSVFSYADGNSNPGRSETYFSRHSSHRTLNKVETLKTLTKVRAIGTARVSGYEDRDKQGYRTSSRSNSGNSNSEKELGEISSGDLCEEFFDFKGDVKTSPDMNNNRKYSWNNEVKVTKSSDLCNKRKYAWNNTIGEEERTSVLLDDEYEPGQIKESPEEEEPLRNIAASRWADDDEDFGSPNPKRVKVSSSPGKQFSSGASVRLSSHHSENSFSSPTVKLSSDSSGNLSSNCTTVQPFLSPVVKPFSGHSLKQSPCTSGAMLSSETSVKLLLNTMGSDILIPESPELDLEEEPLVNIAASRWADDEGFESPNPKRAKISCDPDDCGTPDKNNIRLSASNSGGESLSPENLYSERQRSHGSGKSSICPDSDGSRRSSEILYRGEIGVSDDEHDPEIELCDSEDDLKIGVSDDAHDKKIGVSEDEQDQVNLDGEDDRAGSDLNELSSDSDNPILTPLVALAVRRIDMMQGCRNVDEFERLNKINEGTYGIVYRARNKKTGEIVALKKVKMEREREGFPMSALREINVLLSLQHPSVVNVKEVVVGSSLDNIFMVMEYMEHDLKDFIGMMKQPFSTSEVKCLVLQLLEGVNYLHDNWVLHRDLKTSNLLINNKGELKICDFGLARQYGSPLKTYTHLVVTLWYRAPELLLGAKKYSTAVDMWSVGCIMAELLAKEPLFSGKSEIDQLDKIFRTLGTPNQNIWPDFVNLPGAKCRFIKQQYNRLRERFPAPSFTGTTTLSECGFDLLNRLLTYDPNKRITAEEALNHEWFRELPLPKSKEFMPTYPTRSDHNRQSRRLRKSPDPLDRCGKEAQQDIVSDESPRYHFNTITSIGRTVLKCSNISCTAQAGPSDQVFSGGYLQPERLVKSGDQVLCFLYVQQRVGGKYLHQ
ncbi:hypothetical protein KI387_023248, partial [Taxus chinensis]